MVLPVPTSENGATALEAIRRDPGAALLALDFDGVLAPIVADPSSSRAHPGAVPALARLAPRMRLVAVVTGRPVAVAVEYGGLAGVEGLDRLVVLGHYGVERWDARTAVVEAPPADPGVAAARSALPGLLSELGLDDVVHVEDKGRSVALHTRRAPAPQEALERLRQPLARLAANQGLTLEPGRMVIEMRPPGMDKGAALRHLVAEVSATAVAYVGDDLGDLPAFDAIDELRTAGVAGLKVCSGSAEVTALAERADLVVEGPDGVVQLLTALADELAPS